MLELWTATADASQELRVVGRAEATSEQQQPQSRLIERVLELPGFVGRVDVDQDGPDAGRGMLHHDPLVAVGRPDADPIALGDPPRQQRLGQGRGVVPQLAIGRSISLRADHQRVAVAVLLDGAPQRGPDRLRGRAEA